MIKDRLDPQTRIPGVESATVGSFWSWAYSDIMANTTRGMFAEFLVGTALEIIENSVQSGWEDFDLKYGDCKIEVKASAYLQSWRQDRPSKISFDIGERGSWVAETNSWLHEKRRSADCYVFCVFTERDRDIADVLNIAQWEFYVLSTEHINSEFGNQKSTALSRIQNLVQPVVFDQLKQSIDSALNP